MKTNTKSGATVVRILDLPDNEIESVAKEMLLKFDQYKEIGSWKGFFQKHHRDSEFQCYLLKVGGEYIPALMFCYRTPQFQQGECAILWVAPDHRRRGYARMLVNSVNMIYVTPASNDVTVSFWKAMGYTKGYWKDAEKTGVWYRDVSPQSN